MESNYSLGIMTAPGEYFWQCSDEFTNRLTKLIFDETTLLVTITYTDNILVLNVLCSNLNLSIFYSETIKKYFEDRFNISRLQVKKENYDDENPNIRVIQYNMSEEKKEEIETLLKVYGLN